jgi:ribosome-binding protein aMBF1 (putative translation factor)
VVKCDLCGAPGTRFVRVVHRRHGTIIVCRDCYERERDLLVPLPERDGCGCGR